MSDENSAQFLDWLPPRFPATVRCIVSTRNSHLPCLARLQERHAYYCRLSELTDEATVHMVQHYLGTYNKVSSVFIYSLIIYSWL